MPMKSFGLTDVGKVRHENQDSYIIEDCKKRNCIVTVICDGMGALKQVTSQVAYQAKRL